MYANNVTIGCHKFHRRDSPLILIAIIFYRTDLIDVELRRKL